MNKRRISVQFLLYFFMLMFLMVSFGCSSSDNPSPPAVYTASGTYTWDPQTLTLTWTSTNFPCNGPNLGIDMEKGVTIGTITMKWPSSSDGLGMTWTRSPEGTAGDPSGTWTSSADSEGNTYTAVVTATSSTSGTISVSATINACASRDLNPGAESSYRPGSGHNYQVWMWYDDDPKTATAVSVTGSGITSPMNLIYSNNDNSWSPGEESVDFGGTAPTLPLTYTFSITDTATWTKTVTVSCFLTTVPTNLAPAGTGVTLTPTFSWTGISASDAVYDVEVEDSGHNQIWKQRTLSTSIPYGGPALAHGTTYSFNLQTKSYSTCKDGRSDVGTSFTTAP